MEETTLLRDLTIIFGAAVIVSYAFRAAHLSTITGFLVAGALIGPSGFGLIASNDEIRQMEEIGIILLLFSIGVEFSSDKIRNTMWVALAGGLGQVVLTGTIVGLVAFWLGAEPGAAILLGMVRSLEQHCHRVAHAP